MIQITCKGGPLDGKTYTTGNGSVTLPTFPGGQYVISGDRAVWKSNKAAAPRKRKA